VSRLETRILRKRARKNSKTESFTLSNDQSYLAVEYFLSIAYKTRNQLAENSQLLPGGTEKKRKKLSRLSNPRCHLAPTFHRLLDEQIQDSYLFD